MTGVPADQLDVATRKRLGITGSGRAPRTTRREVGGAVHVVCHDCAAHFTTTASYERHCDQAGHHRFDIPLEGP